MSIVLQAANHFMPHFNKTCAFVGILLSLLYNSSFYAAVSLASAKFCHLKSTSLKSESSFWFLFGLNIFEDFYKTP